MPIKKVKPELGRQPARTETIINILPPSDYIYLMIELKTISLTLEGGFQYE